MSDGEGQDSQSIKDSSLGEAAIKITENVTTEAARTHTHTILALRGLKKEDQSLRPAKSYTMTPCLKNKQRTKLGCGTCCNPSTRRQRKEDQDLMVKVSLTAEQV